MKEAHTLRHSLEEYAACCPPDAIEAPPRAAARPCRSCPDEILAMLGCQRRESPPERLRPSSADDEEEDGPPAPTPVVLPRDEEHWIREAAALVVCACGKN